MSQMPSMPSPTSTMQPHRGTMILVFGILGLVCCIVFGIIAWVMGNGDLRAMDAGHMDPSGRGMTQAGKICGIIGVVLTIVGLIGYVIMLVLGVGLAAAGAGAAGAAAGGGP